MNLADLVKQYGVLICVRCHDFRNNDLQLGLGLYFLIPCHLLIAYLIELVAARQARSSRLRAEKRNGTTSPTEDEHLKFQATWKLIWVAHAVNVTIALAFTTYVVYFHIHHPLIGTLTEMHAIIVWLKTASYAFTNRDLRHAFLHPVKGELNALPEIYKQCPYPSNITFRNLTYFWSAPTLVYQPTYPRTEKIRWVFVFKRLGEVLCLSVFIWFASAQYATPVLLNSLDKIASLDVPSIIERLLKLSTISLVIWLAGFFALFQSFLNALAEVTRFADREFYEAWCMCLTLSFPTSLQLTFVETQGTARAWAYIGAPGTSPSTNTFVAMCTPPSALAGGATRWRVLLFSPFLPSFMRYLSACPLTISSVC